MATDVKMEEVSDVSFYLRVFSKLIIFSLRIYPKKLIVGQKMKLQVVQDYWIMK